MHIRNKTIFTLLLVMLAPLIASAVQARNPDIVPAPLETCNGTNWSGLTFGQTTAKDIKNQFKTGRSDLPMSQELSQPKEVPQKIFALYSDKHDDSPLAMILLRYSNEGPDLANLRKTIDTPEKDYYQFGRLEDWKIITFPNKGIALFELTKFGQATIPQAVLCAPSKIVGVCREFSAAMQPVVIRYDPHANEPKVMMFGTVTVNTDLKGLELKAGEKQDVERTMIDTTAGGTMRYAVGAPGSYVTQVSGSFTPDKGGSLTVTSTISGYSPYGFITQQGSSYKTLPAEKGEANFGGAVNSTDYTVALYEALSSAVNAFQAAMLSSGPPPIETIRAQKWQQLVEGFRSQRTAVSDLSPATAARPPLTPEAQDHVTPSFAKPAIPSPVSENAAPVSAWQSLFTFANGSQTVGVLVSFDGSTYTVSTPKGMRQFKKAWIASIRVLPPVQSVGATSH